MPKGREFKNTLRRAVWMIVSTILWISFAVAVCVFLCMPESKGILYGGISGLVSAIFTQMTFLGISGNFTLLEFLIMM